MYKLKYQKYSKKSKLLSKIQKGGNMYPNALIIGAGPIGLITTLALLKEKSENKLKVNNIFLIERTNYWKPQIFFFQNSYRDYRSIDYLRDIDLELFRKLEKLSCYIGGPPSTMIPYCYNYTENTDVSETATKVRAPSTIYDDTTNTYLETRPEGTKYPLLHMSFHVSTLEICIFDRILEINNENIQYYIDKRNMILS